MHPLQHAVMPLATMEIETNMASDPQEMQDQGEEEQTPKPCPCCGSPADFGMYGGTDNLGGGAYYIECNDPRCGMTTPLIFPCGEDPKPRLLEIWNKRHNVRAVRMDAAGGQSARALGWGPRYTS